MRSRRCRGWRVPHVVVITTIAPVHLEFFGSLAKIADAKAEIFLGLEPGGAAVLNRDNSQFTHLKRRAKEAGVTRIVSFGEHAKADARLIKCALHADCSTVQAEILGTEITYKIGAPGRHLVLNSLAVLGHSRAGRRRSRFGGVGVVRTQARVRTRRADRDRAARRFGLHHRRQLQRQPGFGRGRARFTRSDAGWSAWTPHRRARRYARTWAAGSGAAPRPCSPPLTLIRSISFSAAVR